MAKKITGNSTRRLSACEGKIRFQTFERAQQIARNQARRDEGAKISAYHCRDCGFFHTGNRMSSSAIEIRSIGDLRQRYAVRVRTLDGRVSIAGYSNQADGGQLASVLRSTGAEIVSITERKQRALP